jgi:hypothetical protein
MPCPPPWDGPSATCDRRAAQATRARQPGLEVPAANLGTRDGRAWKPHPRTCRGRRSRAGSPGLQGTGARLARDPRPPVKRGGSVIHVMELEGPNSPLPPPSVEVRGCQATLTRLPDMEGPSARSGRLACQGWRPRHPKLEFAPANVQGHACRGTSIRTGSLGAPWGNPCFSRPASQARCCRWRGASSGSPGEPGPPSRALRPSTSARPPSLPWQRPLWRWHRPALERAGRRSPS